MSAGLGCSWSRASSILAVSTPSDTARSRSCFGVSACSSRSVAAVPRAPPAVGVGAGAASVVVVAIAAAVQRQRSPAPGAAASLASQSQYFAPHSRHIQPHIARQGVAWQ